MEKIKRTPEQIAEIKEEKRLEKRYHERIKEEKLQLKTEKQNVRKEITVLKFMKKTGVSYHHHSIQESMAGQINTQLQILNTKRADGSLPPSTVYCGYRGQQARCLLGCNFSSSEFNSIYEVPLDGTYRFYIYDSGRRGLGSFNIITLTKVEVVPNVPKVNPGAFPFPITAN